MKLLFTFDDFAKRAGHAKDTIFHHFKESFKRNPQTNSLILIASYW